MAKGRKGGPSRMDLRRQSDAAEARDEEEVEVEEEEADEDEDEEEEEAEEAEEASDDDDEDAPKKKKPKAKPKKEPAKPKPKRTRAPKVVVMRAVWVVFDNSNKRLNTFPFKEKKDAESFLEKKQEEKKGTCYLQLVKEEMKEAKA